MNIQEDITNWLKELKGWQTELAYRILSKKIEDSDLTEIITMMKSNSYFIEKAFPNFVDSENEKQIKLLSIESIQNIESLAPRNPLKFEKGKNLIVIYGSNGSGKSGYTKIIKKISGKPHAKDLKPNVFNVGSSNGKCVIKYSIDDSDFSKEWIINNKPIPDLSGINVFDTSIGKGYIEDANAVTYTPKCMTLFEALPHYFSIIVQKLEEEKSKLVKTLPTIPNKYATTESANIYNNLNQNQTGLNLKNILTWNEAKEQTKLAIETQLKETDPQKSALEKRKQKSEVDKIIKEIIDAYSLINPNEIKIVKALKEDVTNKRKIAQNSAQIIAGKSELPGIGSQVWKSLWNAAKEFSLQEVYKENDYPNVGNGARCVLCHQLLDEDAMARLSSFDEFIKSKLEYEATQAEKYYEDKLNKLPIAINQNILSSKCNAANLSDKWLECLIAIWKEMENTSISIKQNTSITINVKYITDNIKILKGISAQDEKKAIQFEADAKQFDREKATKDLLELNTQKWCSEQNESILKEIERLKKIANFDKWISQCNTRTLSMKASAMSQTVITEEYANRFNKELLSLNANKIKVELIKERASRGTITHSLKLKGINGYKPTDILSEGERRIIALASFLADVTSNNNTNPFIFDDPISSLDQQYEEKTIERLIQLSETRQVIVFTHRLSLLGLLYEKCGSEKIQIIGIRTENWGAGEIGDTPLFAKNTTKALNTLKNDKISVAKKIFEAQGYTEYYPHGKMLCSDVRIIIERIVECDLLADVIQRYRQAVNTKGKVDKLAKIKKADCDLINDLMTKYSCYEHSQSNETPIEIPQPNDIETDVIKLLTWLSEFNRRI